jgi:hypothetical protein
MSAKDRFHDAVKAALVKDGWTITDDPYTLSYGTNDVFVDLGAERPFAAQKGTLKILVEIKSFGGKSEVRDLEVAIGQYSLYRMLMTRLGLDLQLFLAVPTRAFKGIFNEPIGRAALDDFQINVLVFDPKKEVIVKWLPSKTTGGSSGT